MIRPASPIKHTTFPLSQFLATMSVPSFHCALPPSPPRHLKPPHIWPASMCLRDSAWSTYLANPCLLCENSCPATRADTRQQEAMHLSLSILLGLFFLFFFYVFIVFVVCVVVCVVRQPRHHFVYLLFFLPSHTALRGYLLLLLLIFLFLLLLLLPLLCLPPWENPQLTSIIIIIVSSSRRRRPYSYYICTIKKRKAPLFYSIGGRKRYACHT